MKILIGGGSGFLGRTLVPVLLHEGHQVTVMGREINRLKNIFPADVKLASWGELNELNPDEFDAVINLAGANIAGKRWSDAYKQEMLSSRVKFTDELSAWCSKATQSHPHLYNASAIGYYGLQNEIPASGGCTETASVDEVKDASFSGQLVRRWERAAMMAAGENVPVTIMRFGVVLRRGEGMLKQLELPARLGLGAVVGSGSQPISWIDADDWIKAILFLLNHPEITGVVNLTAPEIVTQKTFTKTLGNVFHRPSLLWLPAPVVKILFGQMGEELLLSGQAVKPKRLQDLHFTFQYPTLEAALRHEFA